MTTDQLRKACEDGSFYHDMALDVATERDLLYLACRRFLNVLDTQKRTLNANYTEYIDSLNAMRIAVLNSECEMEEE